MFGIFKKRETEVEQAQREIAEALQQIGARVLLITQSGNILMVSESLQSRPSDWFGGQAIEVMVTHPNLDPFFVYYENDDYYFKMARNGSRVSIADAQKANDAETYRSNISQMLCMYVVLFIMKTQGKDIRHPQMSFSHNRIHTNVIAFVKRLSNWYPIQHSDQEPDSATEQKINQINQGTLDIRSVIAIHKISPA
ncbi:hypothetical protein [uncultured Delftia sp.]|uniref:hypothetical protein n=1 Tax=uncultured Delftia sp. TaxID=191464 RepID=UPI002599701D|nr:hypothetical protein [uncultured Delftia sp.]